MQIQRQSDPILRLLDSAQAVEDSVTFHGPITAPLLDERLAPRVTDLEAGPRPDSLPTLFALRDTLGASREDLAAIEEHNIDLLRQITVLSRERKALHGSLEDDFTWLRGNFDQLLGSGSAELQAGLQGPTAQKATRLLRQVKVAVQQLRKQDLDLSEKRFEAFEVHPTKIALKLESKAARYRAILEALRELRRKVQVTRDDKNRMIEDHRKTFFSISRTLEGYYRLAGRDELADRIRPSEARRGRRAVEVEGEGNGDSPDNTSPDGQTAPTDGPDGSSAPAARPPGDSAAPQSAETTAGSPEAAAPPSAESASPSPEGAPRGAPAGVGSSDA